MENLVSNAIKYSPDGTDVTISARAEEEYVAIEVADHGYGIPEADLERVFEKFYRVPRVQDAGVPGTGLGLALVREIAELHHGSVSVRSEVNQGSTFTLRIPRNEARKEASYVHSISHSDRRRRALDSPDARNRPHSQRLSRDQRAQRARGPGSRLHRQVRRRAERYLHARSGRPGTGGCAARDQTRTCPSC